MKPSSIPLFKSGRIKSKTLTNNYKFYLEKPMIHNCPYCKEECMCVCITDEEKTSNFEVEPLPPFPPNENPYHHDLSNMGTNVGNNLTIMFAATSSEQAKYIIVVNKTTGERIKIQIP
jgi:hypothetical protein